MHITSIGQNHPGFAQNPHIQDIKGSEEVNASIIIGTPVNPLAAADAASTVKHISGAECEGFFFFFVESINACAFGRAPRGHFYLSMCRELTIYLCLASLPGVVTNDIIETARNRAHVLRDTRE